ncbi:MAG: hypothetical protein K8S24_09700 [Candidatus Aegiribacteria sp.]|nr:hypothetical protein [Candidatus Aegiribacteria sp.]
MKILFRRLGMEDTLSREVPCLLVLGNYRYPCHVSGFGIVCGLLSSVEPELIPLTQNHWYDGEPTWVVLEEVY